MDKIKKHDDAVMKTLGVNVIRRLICLTNKGQLDLVIRKGENNYFLSIDSVPLEKEINDKLMDILFKVEIPTVNKEITVAPINNTVTLPIKKKMGRPKGSKDGVKMQ
jgi:hypothetical protein